MSIQARFVLVEDNCPIRSFQTYNEGNLWAKKYCIDPYYFTLDGKVISKTQEVSLEDMEEALF